MEVMVTTSVLTAAGDLPAASELSPCLTPSCYPLALKLNISVWKSIFSNEGI